MPVNYTITYNGDTNHGSCALNVSTLTFDLIEDGIVEYDDGATVRDVDLLTLYFTQDASEQYPSPPETFTLKLDYSNGYDVVPIYKDFPSHSPPIPTAVDDRRQTWTVTITGPTNDSEVTNFQLATDGSTPPNKLKIRVKRQPSLTCGVGNGPFDDLHGGELP